MFALLAFLCFVAALLDLSVGVDMVVLGLMFVALHLLLGVPLVFWRK